LARPTTQPLQKLTLKTQSAGLAQVLPGRDHSGQPQQPRGGLCKPVLHIHLLKVRPLVRIVRNIFRFVREDGEPPNDLAIARDYYHQEDGNVPLVTKSLVSLELFFIILPNT
jgi:hypothetical protein